MAGATTTALTLDQERRHARAMQDTRSAETQRAAAPSTTVLVPTVAVHKIASTIAQVSRTAGVTMVTRHLVRRVR